MPEYITKAKEILAQIPYLTIASVGKDGEPHNSPVFSVYDQNYNFFWNSQKEAKHSENIRNHSKIFCVVYNSSVGEGDGKGVYMKGQAFEINDKVEATYALKIFYEKKNKTPPNAEDYLDESPRRYYKFVPDFVYLNTFEKMNGLPVDGKVEIKLK